MFFGTLVIWAIVFIVIVLGLGLVAVCIQKLMSIFEKVEKKAEEKESVDNLK